MSTGWGLRGDVGALLDALYRIDLEDRAWLESVMEAAAPLVPGVLSVIAGRYVWMPGQTGFSPRVMVSQDPRAAVRAVETADTADDLFMSSTLGSERRVYSVREVLGERLESSTVTVLMREFGVADIFGVQTVAHGQPHEGAFIGALCAAPVALHPRGATTFDRIASHLAAATRLRTEGLDAHPVEGVLSPDGRIAHAEGVARTPEHQDALARAVRAIDRARRREAQTDPEVLLDAWRAIVERRWTLSDVVESDGRRFMLARVNPPAALSHQRLTPREQQVAALLVQGVPQKAVGYELAMAPSTVGFHVKNIARKLGARSRPELIRLLAAGRGGTAP